MALGQPVTFISVSERNNTSRGLDCSPRDCGAGVNNGFSSMLQAFEGTSRSYQMAVAGLCRCLVPVTHIPLKQKLLYHLLEGVSAEGRITEEGAMTPSFLYKLWFTNCCICSLKFNDLP